MVPWDAIDTILLDMDGTLLDLRFDTFFWTEHVPRRYAERYGLTVEAAKAELYPRMRAIEGTMDWYCVDYWTEELGLDIARLKEEVDHLIAIFPYVPEFLDRVRAGGKRAVLVTNAHHKSLALKMERTPLGGHLDAVVCAHDLGLPKEEAVFWERLQEVEPFDPARTLLADDNVAVLRSARDYGIGHLLAVLHPDTGLPPREHATVLAALGGAPDAVPGVAAIHSFREVMPPSG